MSPRLPEATVQQIKDLLDSEWTNSAIASTLGHSVRTVQRIRMNLDLFNAPYAPRSVAIGRRRVLTDAQVEVSAGRCCNKYLIFVYNTNKHAATAPFPSG